MLDTDIKKMEERMNALEAECCRLKSLERKFDWTSRPGIEKQADFNNFFPATKPSTASSNCSTDALVLVAPEIKPKIPGNSSCQRFIGALRWHLIRNASGESSGKRASELLEYNVSEGRESLIKRLYLDDNERHNNQSARLTILPEKAYASELINKVFQFFAKEYGLFSITEFHVRLEETYRDVQSQDPSWLAYLMVTLAVGEQYTNDSARAGVKKVPGKSFFSTALKLFHEPIEEPNLDTVRTLLLFALYSQGWNRINSVFTYTGLALSTAIMLGMHREISNVGRPKAEQDARKKVWWIAYFMDILWSSRLGLPPHFNVDYMDLDVPDENLSNEDGFDPKFLIANTKLALHIGSVMKKVYVTSGDGDFITNIVSSLEQLELFRDSLDPELKVVPDIIKSSRSAAILNLRYNQTIIVTVRPLYLSLLKSITRATDELQEAKVKCVVAAVININILNNLRNSGWFCTFGFLEAQCCFSSILMLVMETLDGDSFPELQIALSLNASMCKVGNVTALDNYSRLKELDSILFKAEKERYYRGESSIKSLQPNRTTVATKGENAAVENELLHARKISTLQDNAPLFEEIHQDGLNANLPSLVELESSGAGFEHFSPDTFRDLSMNFERWDTCLDFSGGSFL